MPSTLFTARRRQLVLIAIAAAALSLLAASAGSLSLSAAAESPPETTATGPTGFVNLRQAAFELASSEPGGSFECRMDADEWEGCTEVWYSALLSEGPHVFEGRAVDGVGGVDPTPARVEFTVDREKPFVRITKGWQPTSWTWEAQPTFQFSSAEPVTFTCAFDGAAPGPCAGPDWHHPAAPLGLGAHQFQITATDRAGNVGTAGEFFSVVPPPVWPKISVGKPRLQLSSGRAMLPVKVNREGGLRLLSKSAKGTARGAKKAGTVWLPVVPVGKAAKALAAKGEVKVGVLVRFRTFDGIVEKATKLRLRKQP